jgi:hypothetical protein
MIRILTLTLALAGPACAADWSSADTARQAAFLALGALDWAQTRAIARHPDQYREVNTILGEHPTVAQVNRYFALYLTGHTALAWTLPAQYRIGLQYVSIGIEFNQVNHNAHIGVRVGF